jgi:ABC-2 type transport system permease protein
MPRTLVVARAEYLRAVRTKAFLIGLLATPVLLVVAFVLLDLAKASSDRSDRHFAVLDHAGRQWELLERSAAERNAALEPDGPARFVPERADPSAPEVELTLSDRVRAGELAGFVVIGADFDADPAADSSADKAAADGRDRRLEWHTDKPTAEGIPDWIERTLGEALVHQRFERAGIDRALVEQISRRPRVLALGLAERASDGAVVEAGAAFDKLSVLVPIVLTVLLFVMVLSSTPALLNNVVEEKTQKISEILVASITPFQLLMGKLIGTAGVALTLSVVYVGSGLVFIHVSDAVPQAVRDAVTPGLLGWYALFQVISLFIYGAVLSAIGAACSEVQEAQNAMGWVILVLMFPLWFLDPVITEPGGTVARLLSFFPPTAPAVMLVRIAVPPGVAFWEIGLSVVLTLLFVVAVVTVAGRIFRVGILAQGQTPGLRQLGEWIRRG